MRAYDLLSRIYRSAQAAGSTASSDDRDKQPKSVGANTMSACLPTENQAPKPRRPTGAHSTRPSAPVAEQSRLHLRRPWRELDEALTLRSRCRAASDEPRYRHRRWVYKKQLAARDAVPAKVSKIRRTRSTTSPPSAAGGDTQEGARSQTALKLVHVQGADEAGAPSPVEGMMAVDAADRRVSPPSPRRRRPSPGLGRWRTALLALVRWGSLRHARPRWLCGRWTRASGTTRGCSFHRRRLDDLAVRSAAICPQRQPGASSAVPARLQIIDTGMHTELLWRSPAGAARRRCCFRRPAHPADAFRCFYLVRAAHSARADRDPHLVSAVALPGARGAAARRHHGVQRATLRTVRGLLEVADACSGFSTLYAAMAVSLTAYTAATNARRALVPCGAPLIASNVLRRHLVALVVWRGEPILRPFSTRFRHDDVRCRCRSSSGWAGRPAAAAAP